MKQSLDVVALSKAVKKKRKEVKLDMRELGKLLGCAAGTIWRMENKKPSDINTLLVTCDWLDVSVCNFIKVKK